MNNFYDLFTEFNTISLSEMDNVKLLDRTDTKFIFHKKRLPEIIKSMQNDYKILTIQNLFANDYETLYFDTKSFALYLSHHNGKLNRYKVRYRKYINSNLHFFEIKLKNNKDRTIKKRIKQGYIELVIKDSAKEFLEDITHLSADSLKPVLWVNYSRYTFVSTSLGERLTIDTDLTFKNEYGEKRYDSLVIAEVKQDKTSLSSPFLKIMDQYGIKSNSISKYCLGITQLCPLVKKNNFKPKLLILDKILQQDSTH